MAFMRRKLLRGLAPRPAEYRLAWRPLERVAVRVERVATQPGRPWLWRLKSE